MAKQDQEPPKIVQCAYCGKRVHITEARSFGEFDKKGEIQYFCSVEHALAKLFGVIKKFDEFMLELGNPR